jgi:photosystem II stability/assembly factor-like uncharacterized protein
VFRTRSLSYGLMILALAVALLLFCSCEEDCATCPEPETADPNGWFVQASPTQENLTNLFVIDRNTVVAGGNGGVIVRTTDGGATWSIVASGVTGTLRGVSFVGNTGWIVGDNSTVLKTTDAGATWAPQPVPVTETLRQVSAFAGDLVYVGGGPIGGDPGESVFLKSEDGGESWTSQLTDFTTRLMFFVDPDSGCIAGGSSLQRTTDGGDTWTDYDPATVGWIGSLYFIDNLNGWISGGGGFVGRTMDGGKSWEALNSGTTRNVADVTFSTPLDGWYMARNPGTIGVTSDGGVTWEFQSNPSGVNPSEVDFFDAKTGWIVGLEGKILTTVTGGW